MPDKVSRYSRHPFKYSTNPELQQHFIDLQDAIRVLTYMQASF